ncbi:MAG: V-type ATP synthase subunit I [Methanomassiliicoccales archaeon]|nr:V-type ATP synthase subunit I [Methanomassiliicoccales archaeon]
MLLPEKMSKILIVGSKDKLQETTEVLYNLALVHPIDFSEEEGLSLGSPFPSASDASQKLLKLRALEKDLEIEEANLAKKVPVGEVESKMTSTIDDLNAEVSGVVETKNQTQQRLAALENDKRLLVPLSSIPLDLDLYSGYDNIAVFTGAVRSDPEAALSAAVKKFEIFKSKNADFVAVFVAKPEAAEAQRVLVQNGYSEVVVPKGKGTPEQLIKNIELEEGEVKKALADAEDKITRLRSENRAMILASEEHLSIEVEKAEFPLRIATTKNAFAVDAWVPTKQVENVKKELDSKLGKSFHFEVLEVKSRKEVEHQGSEVEHEADVGTETPVKMGEKKPISMFNGFTELISTPKYNEIDPTNVIAITFPLFFGLMVGDVGYGTIFIALGYIGLKKVTTDDWRTISTMLFFGGIWSTIFGLFLFGEAFGMPFAPHGDELTWSSLLGTALPSSFDLGGISTPFGIYNKLTDVNKLLYLTVWIGIFHLFLGFFLGMFNIAMRHGIKHAIMEKFGWVLVLLGMAILLPVIIANLSNIMNIQFSSMAVIIPLVLIIIGMAISIMGEGVLSILELPGLLSNILSYTRLAAIGVSKAGLALAFNMIAIEMLAPMGGIGVVFGIVIFIVGHLAVLMLAIISAGIHGIRLHYVELFQKFYTGGGTKYSPLRVVRKYTSER